MTPNTPCEKPRNVAVMRKMNTGRLKGCGWVVFSANRDRLLDLITSTSLISVKFEEHQDLLTVPSVRDFNTSLDLSACS